MNGWHKDENGEWHYYKDGVRLTTTEKEADKQ